MRNGLKSVQKLDWFAELVLKKEVVVNCQSDLTRFSSPNHFKIDRLLGNFFSVLVANDYLQSVFTWRRLT